MPICRALQQMNLQACAFLCIHKLMKYNLLRAIQISDTTSPCFVNDFQIFDKSLNEEVILLRGVDNLLKKRLNSVEAWSELAQADAFMPITSFVDS